MDGRKSLSETGRTRRGGRNVLVSEHDVESGLLWANLGMRYLHLRLALESGDSKVNLRFDKSAFWLLFYLSIFIPLISERMFLLLKQAAITSEGYHQETLWTWPPRVRTVFVRFSLLTCVFNNIVWWRLFGASVCMYACLDNGMSYRCINSSLSLLVGVHPLRYLLK